MAVKLIGSEPEDEVPDSFYARLNARDAEIIFCVPEYMEIPFIEDCQSAEIFNSCAGVLIVTLKDLIEDYANNFLRNDGGEGLLPMASFFEKTAKQFRDLHETIAQENIGNSTELIDALTAIKLKLGAPGSRDVDVRAAHAAIDKAIEKLSNL